mmetsp:Transcript_21877/g.36977  ORF Transcript_21877/g.36977 Transcript_21877/m.36977 type:complete len:229 (+) Transcript_21877:208-894(+)
MAGSHIPTNQPTNQPRAKFAAVVVHPGYCVASKISRSTLSSLLSAPTRPATDATTTAPGSAQRASASSPSSRHCCLVAGLARRQQTATKARRWRQQRWAARGWGRCLFSSRPVSTAGTLGCISRRSSKTRRNVPSATRAPVARPRCLSHTEETRLNPPAPPNAPTLAANQPHVPHHRHHHCRGCRPRSLLSQHRCRRRRRRGCPLRCSLPPPRREAKGVVAEEWATRG